MYSQIVGCDCDPQVADLFLYWYEHSYILKAIKDKTCRLFIPLNILADILMIYLMPVGNFVILFNL